MSSDTCAASLNHMIQAQCALPEGSRFDRLAHSRIIQQVHEHMSRPEYTGPDTCEGPGGDLFFFMQHYKALLHRAQVDVEPKKTGSHCVGATSPSPRQMASPVSEHSVPAVPHGPIYGPTYGPIEKPASLTSATHTCFSEAYSEVLVDGRSECGHGSENGEPSECCPGDSVSQAGAPASVAIDIDYFQSMRFGGRLPHTDNESLASTADADDGAISAAMLASIRNIDLNVERLFLHVDRLHASQAVRPRPQRAHEQHQFTPPGHAQLPFAHAQLPSAHAQLPSAHAQYQFTPPARSHGEEGTRVPEKHRGRGRGNARHSQHQTPESYAYVN